MGDKTIGDIAFTKLPERFDCRIDGVYKCKGKNVYIATCENALKFRYAPSYQIACSLGKDEQMDFIDKLFILWLRETGRKPELTDAMNDWVVDYEAKLTDEVWVAGVRGELNKVMMDSLGDNPVQDFMDRQRGVL